MTVDEAAADVAYWVVYGPHGDRPVPEIAPWWEHLDGQFFLVYFVRVVIRCCQAVIPEFSHDGVGRFEFVIINCPTTMVD